MESPGAIRAAEETLALLTRPKRAKLAQPEGNLKRIFFHPIRFADRSGTAVAQGESGPRRGAETPRGERERLWA